MFVGVLEVTLVLPSVSSLKGKRSVVRSALDRVRSRFRVAAAEVDANDVHQRAVLGVSTVGNDAAYVNEVLDKVRDAIESHVFGDAELVDVHLEILNVSFEYQR